MIALIASITAHPVIVKAETRDKSPNAAIVTQSLFIRCDRLVEVLVDDIHDRTMTKRKWMEFETKVRRINVRTGKSDLMKKTTIKGMQSTEAQCRAARIACEPKMTGRL